MKNWFERFFSLDEMRVSALVICLLAVTTTCIVAFFLYGTIDQSLLMLADSLIFTVGGVTAVNGVVSATRSRLEQNAIQDDAVEKDEPPTI